MMSVASQSAVHSMLVPVKATGKYQQESGQKSMRDVPVLLHCSLLRKILDQNRLVCWSIVVKVKPTVGSPFSGRFLPTAFLRRRKMLAYISLFTAGIPVNYINEFRELFEATT